MQRLQGCLPGTVRLDLFYPKYFSGEARSARCLKLVAAWCLPSIQCEMNLDVVMQHAKTVQWLKLCKGH